MDIPFVSIDDEFWLVVSDGAQTATLFLSALRSPCGLPANIRLTDPIELLALFSSSIVMKDPHGAVSLVQVTSADGTGLSDCTLFAGDRFLGQSDSSGIVQGVLETASDAGVIHLAVYKRGNTPVFPKVPDVAKANEAGTPYIVVVDEEEIVIAVDTEPVSAESEARQKSYGVDNRFQGDLIEFDGPFDQFGDGSPAEFAAKDKPNTWRMQFGGWYAGRWAHKDGQYTLTLPRPGRYVLIVGRGESSPSHYLTVDATDTSNIQAKFFSVGD